MTSDVADRAGRWLRTAVARIRGPQAVSVQRPTDAEIEALRLLVNGKSEARDRRLIVGILERFLGGDDAALTELRPHGISLADHRSQDEVLMRALEDRLATSTDRFELSRLAGLRVQMRRWDEALALYDRLAAEGPPSAMDAFLAFQVARIQGHRDRMAAFDDAPLARLADRVPEVRSDLAARYLTMGDPFRFAQDIRRISAHREEAEAIAQMAERLKGRPHGTGGFTAHLAPADWGRIVAVCSLRCSGGSAIQDFIVDHADVRSTAGEYVALSGYMGFRTAHQSNRPAWRTIEFARLHLLGLTVPINRTGSRVLRQARADRIAGLTPLTVQAIHRGLDEEETVRGFLDSLLLSTWRSYLDSSPGPLLMNKMFSGGRLDFFADLPPFRCIMVWRDPRDQYADQVARGFVRPGDTATFIAEFKDKIEGLKKGLRAASADHLGLFLNVGFEPFVLSADYRDGVRRELGLDASRYAPDRFIAEKSAANVGIWRDRLSHAEASEIETALKPYLDTSAIRLDLDPAV